ncbi:MAG: reverse transcriptase family protein, partial [Sedimenticola sp.]
MKESKEAWWKWRIAGKPTSSKHPTVKRRTEVKRQLKKEQRRYVNSQKVSKLENIMSMKDNVKKFHSLVRNQRKTGKASVKCLVVNGESLDSYEQVCEGWASHFQSLAENLDNEKFDETMKNTFAEDVASIENICNHTNIQLKPITTDEVEYAVKRLNTNKAADSMDLTSEHLKFGGKSLTVFLVDLLNYMARAKSVSPILKEGLLSPIYKKGDVTNPSNYRGITVTSVILKIFEHIINKRHNSILDETQSKLQKGFTPGQSSINAALILSEVIAESKNMKQPLIVTTLDAQKAFDVVHHNSLLRKLYLDGIRGDDWLLLKDMYTDLTSVVKWENMLSNPITIKQGVRQGGVLSTTHYKRFNNPLLLQIENKFTGATIGYINIPQVTCADDLALTTHSPNEMQQMIDSVDNFASRERYCINHTKSNILTYKNSNPKAPHSQFYMSGKELPKVSQATHLGIKRTIDNKADIDEKISLGRKAAYSLMGAGLHSGNGLKQSICAELWKTEVLPRMLFGLETLELNLKQMEKLESFQRKCLKQIQGLPDKTSNSAVLALLGIPPIEKVIHKSMLSLFVKIIKDHETVEYDIAVRQLAMKSPNEYSWFNQIKMILDKYDLPTAYKLLSNSPSKLAWKKSVKCALYNEVTNAWYEDVTTKPSLKYINPEILRVGRPHPIWSTVRDNIHDSRMAQLKCRLLTGTYNLQGNRAVFNQYKVNPVCKLCESEPETRQHFLTGCTAFQPEREDYLRKTEDIVKPYGIDINNPVTLTKLILDPSWSITSP